jgi:hypothetical protein
MIKKLLAISLACVVALALLIATLLNWPLPDMPRPGVTADFLIRNVTVVDVDTGQLRPGRDVRIRDGRIDAIDEPPKTAGSKIWSWWMGPAGS